MVFIPMFMLKPCFMCAQLVGVLKVGHRIYSLNILCQTTFDVLSKELWDSLTWGLNDG